MQRIGIVDQDRVNDLTETIARRAMVPCDAVLPYLEFEDFLPELFKTIANGRDRIICGGHVPPEITIAADKANLKVEEILGVSPFTLDPETIRQAALSPTEIIYVSNPNRVTGSNLGLADLKYVAEAVPFGYLIIDEHYLDYYGVSGLPLLEKFPNVIMLRTFPSAFPAGSSAAGYVIADAEITRRLRENFDLGRVGTTLHRTLMESLEDEDLVERRAKETHDEMLRVSASLSRRGVQNRITAADFLLLRVADVVSVGNTLSGYRVPVDNLDGYPQLTGYLRYRVQTEILNNQLLNAFSRMPHEIYRTGRDGRPLRLSRSSEETVDDAALAERLGQRLRRVPAWREELVEENIRG